MSEEFGRQRKPCVDCVLQHPHEGPCQDKYGSVATESVSCHPECILEHPHVGPAILDPGDE